jgi:tripartite-type tricarboxylate transporter receptor subunit TctC
MPELPTLDESGLNGYDITEWYGVLVPAKTPKEVTAELHAELVRMMSAPETKEQLAKQTAEPVTNTPAAALIKSGPLP